MLPRTTDATPETDRAGREDTHAPLDGSRLSAVLRGCNEPAAAFLAKVRQSLDADVGQLLNAAEAGDAVLACQWIHRIEGASRVIGAGPLALACSLLVATGTFSKGAGLDPAIETLLERKRALYLALEAMHPCAASQGGNPAAPAGDQAGQICHGLAFLVAEDHDFQRDVAVRLLRHLGALQVDGFADGAGALAAARELKAPAILVLDLSLPAPDGMEVMRIAARERLPVSIIICSALAQGLLHSPLQAARSCGASVLGALTKPLTAGKLAPLLDQFRVDQLPGERSARNRPPREQA